jgi:hypothetical protein
MRQLRKSQQIQAARGDLALGMGITEDFTVKKARGRGWVIGN